MDTVSGFTVVNPEGEDYHTHTITYSDGFNSVDEMVIHAGRVGLKKLVITDHCQFYLDRFGYGRKTNRVIIRRWENIHNEVEVVFGVEADIMNDKGEVSLDIQGMESESVILSAHRKVFAGSPERITEAYLRSIERYGKRIMFLGHLCSVYFEDHIDVDPIIDLAVSQGIAFELNCANLVNGKTNLENLRKMLGRCKRLFVNSDAHTLSELGRYRKAGFDFLRTLSNSQGG